MKNIFLNIYKYFKNIFTYIYIVIVIYMFYKLSFNYVLLEDGRNIFTFNFDISIATLLQTYVLILPLLRLILEYENKNTENKNKKDISIKNLKEKNIFNKLKFESEHIILSFEKNNYTGFFRAIENIFSTLIITLIPYIFIILLSYINLKIQNIQLEILSVTTMGYIATCLIYIITAELFIQLIKDKTFSIFISLIINILITIFFNIYAVKNITYKVNGIMMNFFNENVSIYSIIFIFIYLCAITFILNIINKMKENKDV